MKGSKCHKSFCDAKIIIPFSVLFILDKNLSIFFKAARTPFRVDFDFMLEAVFISLTIICRTEEISEFQLTPTLIRVVSLLCMSKISSMLMLPPRNKMSGYIKMFLFTLSHCGKWFRAFIVFVPPAPAAKYTVRIFTSIQKGRLILCCLQGFSQPLTLRGKHH